MINNSAQKTKGKNAPIVGGNISNSRIGDEYNIFEAKSLPNKPREVKSILKLICLITDYSRDTNVNVNQEDKDLNKKINIRFKKFKASLSSQFVKLNAWHSDSYEQAISVADISETQADKNAEYLRKLSVKYLSERENNPLEALDGLTEYFTENLSTDIDAVDFESSAIRFYLYKQLIACNVFPNPEEL
ncbi:MAG: hypothetical protein WCT22_05080 [Patescibacteria group bacterium]|jgi:molecular chaperone DnaK (HSP70)